MGNDDLKEKNEEKEEVATQEPQKSEDEQNNKKKKNKITDEDLDALMEQMQKLVNEVSDEYGVDPDKVKVMPIPKPKFTFLSVFVSSLVILLFDFVIIVAFSAIFDWATWEKTKYLIFYALMFSCIEITLKIASLGLFSLKIKNIVVLSFIKILPFIVTSIICGIWPVFINITSYFLYILICILIYAIRKFYTTYLLEKQMNSLLNRHFKRKIKKISRKGKDK